MNPEQYEQQEKEILVKLGRKLLADGTFEPIEVYPLAKTQ